MTDVVKQNIPICVSDETVKPLFGFAVDDYIAKYDLKNYPRLYGPATELEVVGGIIEEGDSLDDVFSFIYANVAMGMDLIIFDINKAGEKLIANIRRIFRLILGYEELEGVYEDRIVFCKNPKTMCYSRKRRKTLKENI